MVGFKEESIADLMDGDGTRNGRIASVEGILFGQDLQNRLAQFFYALGRRAASLIGKIQKGSEQYR